MRWILAAIALILAVFLAFPEIDLAVSRAFYEEGKGFPLMHHPLTIAVYYSVRFATWSTAALLAGTLLVRWLKPTIRFLPSLSRRHIAYLLITAILGPGIIVHWGIKEYYGRARPMNIAEFGGTKTYTPPFVVSDAGEKSFVSGHAAMGFWFTAFGLASTGKRKKQLYAGGLGFGLLAAAARVLQGKHFLSDVAFAALLVLLLNHFLARLMLASPQGDAPPPR